MLRGTAIGIVVVTFIAAGALGASAIRGRSNASAQSRDSAKPTHASIDSTNTPVAVQTASAAPATAKVAEPHPAPVPQTPPFAPILPSGASRLDNDATAVRGDSDAVVVTFDNIVMRTRRAEKFEQIVRTTLAEVYGPEISTVLAHVPEG
ncbi:MAG: hypothetical protein ACREBE_03995, partial [bacterium]